MGLWVHHRRRKMFYTEGAKQWVYGYIIGVGRCFILRGPNSGQGLWVHHRHRKMLYTEGVKQWVYGYITQCWK